MAQVYLVHFRVEYVKPQSRVEVMLGCEAAVFKVVKRLGK